MLRKVLEQRTVIAMVIATGVGALGVHAGLFTSPHLREFRECIQTTRVDVSEAELLGQLAAIQTTLPEAVYEPMSFFEINTLLAFLAFAAHGTELDILKARAVGEVPLKRVRGGGRTQPPRGAAKPRTRTLG